MPQDIVGGVDVAVMDSSALRTRPPAIAKPQELIDMMTRTTGLAGCIEPVYLTHFAVVLRSNMLKLLNERCPAEVTNLATPQTGHSAQIQILYAEDVVLPAKIMSELPLPVITAVGYLFMKKS